MSMQGSEVKPSEAATSLGPGPQTPNKTAPSFEASVKRLGEIIEQLENGELALDDSLRLFEEGVRLVHASQARLDFAEKRVEELLTLDEHGNPVVREIDAPGVNDVKD